MPPSELFLPVDQAYDRWSSAYDAADNPMVFVAGRAVAALPAAGRAVAEFGCGTGRNLAALKAAGARRLVGMDLSGGMLAEARARDPGFELLHQDMAAPAPLPDGAFDLVLFCLTLEHVADLAAPLKEARRLLAPGGEAAVIEIHPFLSLAGVGAHFEDRGLTVRMPTVAHRVSDFLNAFAAAELMVSACREWRPADLDGPLPPKLLKRGPATPYVIEFRLRASPDAPASA